MRTLLKWILLAMPTLGHGQFIISGATNFTVSEDATIAITTNGLTIAAGAQFNIADNPAIDQKPNILLTNAGLLLNNTLFDFSNTNFVLDLNGGDQTVQGNFTLQNLNLTSPGTKTING